MSRWLLALTITQAVYFGITGIWPIVHIKSFMKVTGPKRDLWLVRTVGWVVTAIAITLAFAAWRRDIDASIFLLAVSSAAFLAGIDVYYSMRRVISKIYLIDAAVEVVLIFAWLLAWNA